MSIKKVPTFKIIWISFFILLSLNACGTVSGNVVPKSGPKMEKVYDSMQGDEVDIKDEAPIDKSSQKSLSDIQTDISQQVPKPSDYDFRKYQKSSLKDFKQIPNPELMLYVYPHFAGQEQVPVPGYFTGFSGCEKISFYEIKN